MLTFNLNIHHSLANKRQSSLSSLPQKPPTSARALQRQTVFCRVNAFKPMLFTLSTLQFNSEWKNQANWFSLTILCVCWHFTSTFICKGGKVESNYIGNFINCGFVMLTWASSIYCDKTLWKMWCYSSCLIGIVIQWWQKICISNSGLFIELENWICTVGASLDDCRKHRFSCSSVHLFGAWQGIASSESIECGEQTIDSQFILMNNVNVASNYRPEEWTRRKLFSPNWASNR